MNEEVQEEVAVETPIEDVDTTSDVETPIEDVVSTPDDENTSLRSEMDDLRRRTDTAEANSKAVQDIYSQTLTAQDKARQEQSELEAISVMTPEERLQYQGEIEKRELRQIAASTQAQLADQQDKSDFTIMALDNPVVRQHRDEVEKRLNEARSAGYNNVKRETLLKDLLGEKVLEGVMNGNTTQVENAKTTQQRSASKPTESGGDTNDTVLDKASSDRDARNERLRNKSSSYN